MPGDWVESEIPETGPTAKFWANSDATPITYDGELEGAAIAKWIAAAIQKDDEASHRG